MVRCTVRVGEEVRGGEPGSVSAPGPVLEGREEPRPVHERSIDVGEVVRGSGSRGRVARAHAVRRGDHPIELGAGDLERRAHGDPIDPHSHHSEDAKTPGAGVGLVHRRVDLAASLAGGDAGARCWPGAGGAEPADGSRPVGRVRHGTALGREADGEAAGGIDHAPGPVDGERERRADRDEVPVVRVERKPPRRPGRRVVLEGREAAWSPRRDRWRSSTARIRDRRRADREAVPANVVRASLVRSRGRCVSEEQRQRRPRRAHARTRSSASPSRVRRGRGRGRRGGVRRKSAARCSRSPLRASRDGPGRGSPSAARSFPPSTPNQELSASRTDCGTRDVFGGEVRRRVDAGRQQRACAEPEPARGGGSCVMRSSGGAGGRGDGSRRATSPTWT